jgi:hypothetical protein
LSEYLISIISRVRRKFIQFFEDGKKSTDDVLNADLYQCLIDHIDECTELIQAAWLEECHSKIEMEEHLTACTIELCGHETEDEKTNGKLVMMTAFIQSCREHIKDRDQIFPGRKSRLRPRHYPSTRRTNFLKDNNLCVIYTMNYLF